MVILYAIPVAIATAVWDPLGTIAAYVWAPVIVLFWVFSAGFLAQLYCPHCQKRLKAGADVCHHCGRQAHTGA